MPQTNQKIGLWMSTSLVTGNMIGSGIFLLPASLAVYGGISIFGWLYTAAGALFLSLVFARLSRIVPKAGGPYAYTRIGFGNFAGFLIAWGYWISIWCGNAAISVAMVGYLTVFFPILKTNPIGAVLTALSAIWFLTWVNARGIRQSGSLQLITTGIKLLPLLLLGVVGIFYLKPYHFSPLNISTMPAFNAVTRCAALSLWAFLGLESTTIPAQNIRNPERTIPKATILGTLATAGIYILSTTAVIGIIPPAVLARSTAPFADAAGNLWGTGAEYFVAAGAAVSCFGALNGWILLQGQIPLAAALDGLFPKRFSRLSGKGAPLFGLVFSSIMVSVLMSMNFTKSLVEMFTFMILLATLATLVPYLFCSSVETILYFRNSGEKDKRKLLRILIIAIPAFCYSLWAVTGLGAKTLFWGLLLILTGVPVYFLIKKQKPIKA